VGIQLLLIQILCWALSLFWGVLRYTQRVGIAWRCTAKWWLSLCRQRVGFDPNLHSWCWRSKNKMSDSIMAKLRTCSASIKLWTVFSITLIYWIKLVAHLQITIEWHLSRMLYIPWLVYVFCLCPFRREILRGEVTPSVLYRCVSVTSGSLVVATYLISMFQNSHSLSPKSKLACL